MIVQYLITKKNFLITETFLNLSSNTNLNAVNEFEMILCLFQSCCCNAIKINYFMIILFYIPIICY